MTDCDAGSYEPSGFPVSRGGQNRSILLAEVEVPCIREVNVESTSR